MKVFIVYTPPQLRGLGCGVGAGVVIVVMPASTSCSKCRRPSASNRELMSEVVSSRYRVKRISASRETPRGSVAEVFCIMEMLLCVFGVRTQIGQIRAAEQGERNGKNELAESCDTPSYPEENQRETTTLHPSSRMTTAPGRGCPKAMPAKR